MQAEPKKRQGRRPLPKTEALVGYGMHLRPTALEDLREVAGFRGVSVREFIEAETAQAKARIRKDPLYEEWILAGRPVPISDWVEAGKPADWPTRIEPKG